MIKILKEDKLEELLVANWAKILDSSKLMNFVLQSARDYKNRFVVLDQQSPNKKSLQITVSRFGMMPTGFLIWVEFVVPLDNKISVGTTELHLANSGILTHVETIGTIYNI